MHEDDDDLTNPHDLPIHRKSKEVFDLVNALLDAAPEVEGRQGRMFEMQKQNMLSDAMLIMSKIAGAAGGDLYDLRMENAAIIRKAARDLVVGLRGLAMFGWEDQRYFDLLRSEMEAFRLLFIDWVAGFDRENYIIDRWGLFNPPGVGPFDKDPDDDIPFDPKDLLGD
jgi:hypothetical protein